MALPAPVPTFRLLPPPGPITEGIRRDFADFFRDRAEGVRRIGQLSLPVISRFWELAEDPEVRDALAAILIREERLLAIEDERDDLTSEKRSLKGRR